MQNSKSQFKNQNLKTWRKVRLGEIVNVFGGGTPSTHNPEYWGGDISWLTPAEVSGFSGRFIEKTRRNISEAGLKNSSAKLMPANSLLLTSRATIGDVVINKVPMATNQGFINILPNKEVDRQFLFYWLKRKREYFNQIAVGSTFLELIKSVFKKIEVELPDLNEQKRIAAILSAFDDKIELNNKISRTLEEIASAIFKEWFVKFRFSGYEKAEFVDSELGRIPEGWKIRKLGDLIRLDRGVSYSGAGLTENGLPMINLGCFLRGGNFSYENLKFYSEHYQQNQLVNVGDIVIANTDITQNREIIGNPAIVSEFRGNKKFLFTHHVFALRNNSEYSNYFFYFLLRTPSFRGRAAGFATGTNVLALPKDALLELPVVSPLDNLASQFSEFANLVLTLRVNNENENQKLSSLRDLLLPKLMSGEVKT